MAPLDAGERRWDRDRWAESLYAFSDTRFIAEVSEGRRDVVRGAIAGRAGAAPWFLRGGSGGAASAPWGAARAGGVGPEGEATWASCLGSACSPRWVPASRVVAPCGPSVRVLPSADREFIEARRRALKRFINLVARHPPFSEDVVLKLFLSFSGPVSALRAAVHPPPPPRAGAPRLSLPFLDGLLFPAVLFVPVWGPWDMSLRGQWK